MPLECAVTELALTWDQTCNPDMCPDWESNWQPFGSQAGAAYTEPHQPGWLLAFFKSETIEIHLEILSKYVVPSTGGLQCGRWPYVSTYKSGASNSFSPGATSVLWLPSKG